MGQLGVTLAHDMTPGTEGTPIYPLRPWLGQFLGVFDDKRPSNLT